MAKNKKEQIFVDPYQDFPLDTPEKIRRASVATSFILATKPLKTFGERVVAFVEGAVSFVGGAFWIYFFVMGLIEGDPIYKVVSFITIPISVAFMVFGVRVLFNFWMSVWGYRWLDKAGKEGMIKHKRKR